MKKIGFLCAVVITAVTCLLFNSCKHNTDTRVANDPVYTDRDTTIKPGDDFFSYANGGWLKKNPIPAAYSSWGIGNVVEEDLRDKLKKINEDALTANAPKGSNTQKIGDFYFSGMDTVDIEKEGLSPLKPELDKIAAVTDIKSLINEFAHLHDIGVTTPLGCYAGQDPKNSAKIVMQLGQDGIGLPDRDYYSNTDEHSVAIRNDYQKNHLPTLFKLSGMNDAEAASATAKTYALEKSLADSSRTMEALRDPYKNYNKMPLAGLEKLTPLVDWKTAFAAMDYKGVDTVIVGQPEYFRALNKALTAYTIADWKNYMTKNLIGAYAAELSKPFELEDFRFSAIFSGSKAQLPRWKRVIDAENSLMGEVLGQIFVKEYFPEKTKKRYVTMVENMRASFKEHIQNLDWMSDATKQKAYYKLSKVIPKVGYPDKWKDFSTLTIDRGPFALNVMRANTYWHLFEANKLGKPVDRTEWDITPQTYNAYYNPSNNEIVLPAAQFSIPGIKDEDVDDAVVYGYAAASTIGHEMTHGFDDQGRQYDEKGNLKEWWTPADSVQFTKRTKKIIDQFSSYVVYGLHVKGAVTQGENIADLGGIVIGITAFQKTNQYYKEGKTINGLTPMQRFFLGYALGWLEQDRKERVMSQILTNPHSPAFLRVNGPFSDVPEFYQAFNIKEGDKMWVDSAKRVKIW